MKYGARKRKAQSKLIAQSSLTTLSILALILLSDLLGCVRSDKRVRLESADVESVPVACPPSLDIGRMAPTFTLLNQNGQFINLRSLRGSWVVLYFFPKHDTPDCACHATKFTAVLTEFHQMNAKVLGINRDSQEKHRMLKKKYSLELDLLSDPLGNTMQSYEAYVDSIFGIIHIPRVIRSTFLVDPSGRIQFHWPEVTAKGHTAEVKEILSQLQKIYALTH